MAFANAGDTSIAVPLLAAEQLIKEVNISTREQTATANGTIDLVILRGNQYEPATTTPISVTVQEKDLLPTISISRKDGLTTDKTEGADAVFSVTATNPATGIAPTDDIMVKVTISQTGNFIADPADLNRTVPVRSGASADLTVATSNDDNDEVDGSITATIAAETAGSVKTYQIGSNNTQTIGFTDNDDPPIASIVANYNAPEESGANTIDVTLSTASAKTVMVEYSFGTGTNPATAGTDFTASNGTLTFNPDQIGDITLTTMPIPFTILQDSESDPSETFTITLSIPTNGNASVNDATKTTTVTIVDDEAAPVIPVLMISAGPDVTEGPNAKASFTISSDDNLGDGFKFNYQVAQTGDFLTSATTTGTPLLATEDFMLSNSKYTTTLEFAIEDDGTKEETGAVMLTLLAKDNTSDNYTITNPPSASVSVFDDDTPKLSIANGLAVTEGSGAKATFTITSNRSITGQLRIRYLPDDDFSNFLTSGLADSNQDPMLNFNGGTTANIELDIVDDEVVEEDGTVQVTLLADDQSPANYVVVDAEKTGSVMVSDNDTLPTNPTVTIATEPQPAGATTATFYVTIPTTQTSDFEVVVEYNYATTENGTTTYTSTEWTRTVATIPAAQTYGFVSLDLTLQSQGAGGASGGATGQAGPELVVRLADGANYDPDPAQTEPIGVSEQQTTSTNPLVSINPVGGTSFTEAETLTFEVSASPDPTSDVPVTVHITQVGDFISETLNGQNILEKMATIPSSGTKIGSVQFTVGLDEDALDEANGTITAVIQTGNGFSLGDQSQSVTVQIQDNDPLPELTIADATPSNEGNGSNNGIG